MSVTTPEARAAGLGFEVTAADGTARTGRLMTAHGVVQTPAFMPVGTAGTVKAMTPAALAEAGSEILLANTYHLMLRPGAETIAALGGLHAFMNWPGPLLTDSGGFQVMSLAPLREISESGVIFRSHLDGLTHELTPRRCIQIQAQFGVDIAMVLDECTAYPASHEAAEASMRLTLDWAEQCQAAFTPSAGIGLFGIVQGSVYPDLRAACAHALVELGFDGYAIGGLAVGEGQAAMFEVVDQTVPLLPADQPRYLMGVGRPEDIIGAVRRGIDLFDCVLPTRSGRTGQAFTRRGTVNLRNARHASDPRPLDGACVCPACTGHSRAYLHHLMQAKEILGAMLLTWHNLTCYQDLMRDLRSAIETRQLDEFAEKFAWQGEAGDIEPL